MGSRPLSSRKGLCYPALWLGYLAGRDELLEGLHARALLFGLSVLVGDPMHGGASRGGGALGTA